MKNKKPHPYLLAMLQGPKVPQDFLCDGCSLSPDGYWYWACRIHDFQAKQLRLLWKELILLPPEDSAYKAKFEEWYTLSGYTQQCLKDNIRILSLYKIKNETPAVRNPLNPKRFFGYKIATLYSRVTASLFRWQTTAEDH